MEDLNYQESLPTEKKNLFPFDIERVKEIHKAGLTLDLLYVLNYIKDEGAIEDKAFDPYVKTLVRKCYLTENSEVSKSGQEILDTINEGKSLIVAKKAKKEKVITDFDRWWKAYPTSDAFPEAGYFPTRSLKVELEKCREMVQKILGEGEYTIEDLILAIETEVKMKKQESLKHKENKLKYLTNTGTWLRQKKYIVLIEIARTQPVTEPIKKVNKSFDI